MKNTKIITLSLIISITCYIQISAKAFAADLPEIVITMPSTIEDGIIVPVNIVVSGVSDADSVKTITLDVKSNPSEHSRVYSIHYLQPQIEYKVGARARMTPSQQPVVEVTVLTQSGKSFSKQLALMPFNKGINFDSTESLTASIPGAFHFTLADIGQPKIKIVPANGQTGGEFKCLIHHPMLPKIASSKANYIDSVDYIIDNQTIAHIDVGDATSNDPYFGIWIPNTQVKAKVVWQDTVGRKFEAFTN